MERLTKVWNSLRAMLLRAVRERKRECLTVGAGTAVVIAAVGSPQFSPTEDGRIYTVTVSDDTREAVNRAIDGDDLSQGALYFIAKDQADEKNVKWFDEKLTFLFAHGGHSFYI